MKLKLLNKIADKPCFVYIHKNKIIKYEGLYPLIQSQTLKTKYEIEDFNNIFEAEVLDDYDRKSYDINATHLLHSRSFELHIQHKVLVRANKVQSLIY